MAHDQDFETYLRDRTDKFRREHAVGRMDEETLLLFILETQQGLASNMSQLRKEIHEMSTSIVTRDQFDQALKDGITTIVTKIDDLAAKVAAGTVATPEDFSAELATLQTGISEALTKDPAPAAPVDGTTDNGTDGSTDTETAVS